MSKRFTETDIWDEDWFFEMPKEYKLFWYFVKDRCNHAGVWRPNKARFESMNRTKIDLRVALEYFNTGKERITVLKSGHWFINDFFVFQYGGNFNPSNRVHQSIQSIYNQEDIKLTSIRGLNEVKLTSTIPLKDKDKDKDKDKEESLRTKNKNSERVYFVSPILNQLFIDFLEMRKKIKKPATDRAIELLIKKLKDLSPIEDVQVKIVEQSIMNGYQDLYPIKTTLFQNGHEQQKPTQRPIRQLPENPN